MKLRQFDFSKKIFYHADRVAALQAGRRPFPVTVEIDLTNRCNHRCAFCFHAKHLAVDRSTLESAVALRVLDELASLGARGVSFTGGGEPLLHPEFETILAHARATGLDLGLITNGTAITPRRLPALLRQLSWIRISIAGGDAPSYRALQGVDHFERVLGALAALARERLRSGSALDIGVRMLLTPANVHTLPALATRLAPMGIHYLQVAPDQFTRDGGAWWNGAPTRECIDQAERILAGTPTRVLTSGYVWHQDKLSIPRACYAHFFQIAILADGQVAFCKNARGERRFYLGDVNRHSLARIWEGAVNRNLERGVTPANCGLYCKHIQMNLALEEVLHPRPDMTPNFVG